jgi:ATP-dependent Lon protease
MPEKPQKLIVRKDDLKALLGTPPYRYEKAEKSPRSAWATGLAWTTVGGVTCPLRSAPCRARARFQLTGQLGDVMKNRARCAFLHPHEARGACVPADFTARRTSTFTSPRARPPRSAFRGVTLALAMARRSPGARSGRIPP